MKILAILYLFLYFPEDKTEYIPAVLTFVIFAIGAFVTFVIFKKVSAREEQRAKILEEKHQMKDPTE
ncbi:hypothetical protein ACSVDA_20225 [Cytobacillus sp. Hm23]